VHVKIDDRRAPDQPLSPQLGDGNRDIVEHAEAFAMVGKRVVRAARQIRGQPIAKRSSRRQQGSRSRQGRALP